MAGISLILQNNPTVTGINCGSSSPKLGGTVNLSAFPNLTQFICQNNDITSISGYENNANLQDIRLTNNKISGSLPSFTGTPNLTTAVYNATTSLGTLTSELAFFDNALVYPSVVGNMSGAVYKAGTVPDYSALSGTKYLYRRFLHNASDGSNSQKNITISWTGMTSGFVANTTALASQNAYIHIKIPESTGYRDLLVAAPTSYTQFDDNVGCGDGAAINSGTAKTINMRNQSWPGLPSSDTNWLVRITATTGWTGRITQITVA